MNKDNFINEKPDEVSPEFWKKMNDEYKDTKKQIRKLARNTGYTIDGIGAIINDMIEEEKAEQIEMEWFLWSRIVKHQLDEGWNKINE